MDSLKSLTESLKATQSGKDKIEETTVNNNLTNTINENNEKTESTVKRKRKSGDLVNQILEFNKSKKENKKAGEKQPYLHIRLDEKSLRRIKSLTLVGLSAQAIVEYLVNDFLDKAEIKELQKKILSDDLG